MLESREKMTFSPKKHEKFERKHFQGHFFLSDNFYRWFTTALLLILVLSIAFNHVEEHEFLELLEHSHLLWLVLGLLLQVGTYYAQAFIWKTGLKAFKGDLGIHTLARLSLAQLFINQAIPSASLSGVFFMSKAFIRRKIPRPLVTETIMLSTFTYFGAFAFVLIPVFFHLAFLQYFSYSMSFFIASLLLTFLSLIFIFRKIIRLRLIESLKSFSTIKKLDVLQNLQQIISTLEFENIKFPLFIKATLLQLLLFFLDFLTLWSMIKACGFDMGFAYVFTTYVVAYAAKSFAFIPGGVGIFEAVSISILHHLGLNMAGAIASTLLYRGLSFWLPMIPGFFIVRQEFYHKIRAKSFRTENFWNLNWVDLFNQLKTSGLGLSSEDARLRLIIQGPNQISEQTNLTIFEIFWNQIKNPLVFLLVFASALSLFLGEWIEAGIIFTILFTGSGIGTWREKGAQNALENLRKRLALRSTVKRDGVFVEMSATELVPGDVIKLQAGSLVPADALVLNSFDFYVNEAAISGESFPVLKSAVPDGILGDVPLGERRSTIFLGSHVQTGMAECLIVNTGAATLFGTIAQSVAKAGPQTDFDRGISSFGYMLLKSMIIIVMIVFTLNSFTTGLSVQSLMFSVALAVGLSPELLPLIVNYNLAMSAKRLADKGLLVRHPKAIQNIASMNILCTDKTGTITEGVVKLEGAYDELGVLSQDVLFYAQLNAFWQTGMPNPLDDVLRQGFELPVSGFIKMGEVPYDFKRKRLSIVINENHQNKIVTKGALDKVLEVCRYDSKGILLDSQKLSFIKGLFEKWSNKGARVLGVATKNVIPLDQPGPELESDLHFLGILVFGDTAKKNIAETLKELSGLGVKVKIITGDNTLVTQSVAREIGLDPLSFLTSKDLDGLTDEALPMTIERIDLFTQVDPHQKERIVTALRKSGHTVGFMGDGINDVSAMHASDVSISVETAVDVAKSTADFVLMNKSLELIRQGILDGRVTYRNSIKYINITMSANLGNMISMAVASLVLPFLPLLAGQVLLNNLLSDVPSMGLAADNVDEDQIQRPTKWDLKAILKYMLVFGLISTSFDLMTFYIIYRPLQASVSEFRTAWFMESLLTELLVVMVLRTKKRFYQSLPSKLLLYLTIVLVLLALAIPFLPFANLLGFVPLRLSFLASIVTITIFYLITTESVKNLVD